MDKKRKKFKWVENVLEENVGDLRSGWLCPEPCQNKCDAYCTDICSKTTPSNSRHIHALDENGNEIPYCQQGNVNYDRGVYKEIK